MSTCTSPDRPWHARTSLNAIANPIIAFLLPSFVLPFKQTLLRCAISSAVLYFSWKLGLCGVDVGGGGQGWMYIYFTKTATLGHRLLYLTSQKMPPCCLPQVHQEKAYREEAGDIVSYAVAMPYPTSTTRHPCNVE